MRTVTSGELPSTQYQLPYGAVLQEDGVRFSFVSRSATGARLLLYDDVEDAEPSLVLPLDPERNRIGDVWSLFVPNLQAGALYHFQVDGPWTSVPGDSFDSRARLIDPYARALAGDFLPKKDGVCLPPKCVVVDERFDWGNEPRIQRHLADEIIYEAHVRGFTNSPSSGVSKPGSYLGLIEKIPYLQSLGVTAIELMPVHEFPRNNPDGTRAQRQNYWGYDPIAFFAPHRGYAWNEEPGAQTYEFKEMVRAFHCAGLEVFLDVVFNHTAEGNERGEIFSFKGFENRNYYMLDQQGRYFNYSGCGNTVNGNHPWMRELIFNCLRSWAYNYHIDGFRFDLASILSRDRTGALTWNAPIIELISDDPLLSDVKIIAEAWDAGGAYQVGEFGSARWAEWNGRFRDDIRRYWRGDSGTLGAFATRFSGSSDLYQKRSRRPSCSINFVTAHDGFTLNDLVSYNCKHNYANGEDNRDGESNNNSYNFGVEGTTNDPRVTRLRDRQIRNFLATLLLSQGVPMLVAGDEVKRTQNGNNNAYCQDAPISWFDWSLVEKNSSLKRFVAALTRFRRQEAGLRRRSFFTGQPQEPGALPDVAWFNQNGGYVDWQASNARTLACLIAALDPLKDEGFLQELQRYVKMTSPRFPFDALQEVAPESKYHIMVMCNSSCNAEPFYFPALAKSFNLKWRVFVNTSAEPPYDVYPEYNGPLVDTNKTFVVPERSLVTFIAEKMYKAS
ncbi:MAG: glycogen debranching protein GlgX [Planctomycetia bacterium]|nr:glycogen debranching protein GlgX [Planctomycetia bacterium]